MQARGLPPSRIRLAPFQVRLPNSSLRTRPGRSSGKADMLRSVLNIESKTLPQRGLLSVVASVLALGSVLVVESIL